MANSVQVVVSGGGLTQIDLSINYFDRTHIHVYYDNVEQTVDTTWSWSGTTDKKILLDPAVDAGVVITIRRRTPLDAQRHVYSSPGNAAFNKTTVDENFLQTLYASQEAAEGANLSELFSDIDMNGNRITGLDDPLLDDEAVNYKTLKTWMADSGQALRLDLASSATGLGVALVAGAGRVVDSITALRAVASTTNSRVFVTGYYAAGDGGGGPYWYDSTDTTSSDNGGTIIVATDGGRWKLIVTGTLSLQQFGAKGDGVTDDRSRIQAALNAFTNNITIKGNGKAYRTTGSVYIRGNQKVLDFESGQLLLDTTLNNQQAVVIDNPNPTPTTHPALKNVYIYASATTQTKTDIFGVVIENGVLHPRLENVAVQGMGQSGTGAGVVIRGGPLGGTDTPYYGTYINVKVQLCNVGIYVVAPLPNPIITTHTFINPTVGGCISHGVYFYNAQSCTLISPHIEQNGGTNIRYEKCGEIYTLGGFNEGGNPNVEYIDTNPNFSNITLANVYPTVGGTGTTTATYWENPAIGFQSNAVLLNRVSSTQLNFLLDDTLELKFPGCVSVYGSDGRYARFFLSNGNTELIESGAIAGIQDWSTVKDAASKINVYYETGKYYIQNKVGNVFVRLYTEHGF